MRLIFMFPGQTSRDPEMISRPLALHPPCQEVLDRASELLGSELVAALAAADEDVLQDVRNVHFTAFISHRMYLRILEDAGWEADASVGFSLGEYSHLAHIGALGDAETLSVLGRRGTLYDEGPSGSRVALFPVSRSTLDEALRAAGGGGAEIAAEMTPWVFLVGGGTEACRRVVEWIEQRSPETRSRWLSYPKPVHTSHFRPVGDRLRPILADVPFAAPGLPYCPNVLGRPLANPSRADCVDLLARHPHEPILWRQTIDALVDGDEPVRCVEVGPGTILTRYLALDPSWHPEVEAISLDELFASHPGKTAMECLATLQAG